MKPWPIRDVLPYDGPWKIGPGMVGPIPERWDGVGTAAFRVRADLICDPGSTLRVGDPLWATAAYGDGGDEVLLRVSIIAYEDGWIGCVAVRPEGADAAGVLRYGGGILQPLS